MLYYRVGSPATRRLIPDTAMLQAPVSVTPSVASERLRCLPRATPVCGLLLRLRGDWLMIRWAAVFLQCITWTVAFRGALATQSCVDWTVTANDEVRDILESFDACTAAYWQLAVHLLHKTH